MPRVILITGFVAFSTHEENISEQIVEILSTTCIPGVQIETSILSVDEAGSKETSERLYRGEKFDAILHLGLSEQAENIRLERFAKNRFEMQTPDNSGRQIADGAIILGSQPIVETLMPLALIDEILDEFEEVRLSEDAGGFICNETYYRTLKAAIESSSPPVLFIHLPSGHSVPMHIQLEVVSRICKRLSQLQNEYDSGFST